MVGLADRDDRTLTELDNTTGDRRKRIISRYVERGEGEPPAEEEIAARMRAEGLRPQGWGNAPGDRYGRHAHGYEKVLYCVSGTIVFHTDVGDLDLHPGDRMVLPPRTAHAATVGPQGVRCIEAAR